MQLLQRVSPEIIPRGRRQEEERQQKIQRNVRCSDHFPETIDPRPKNESIPLETEDFDRLSQRNQRKHS